MELLHVIPGVIEVRKIGGPEEFVSSDKVHHMTKGFLVRVSRDLTLTLEVDTWLFFQVHGVAERAVIDCIHAVEEIASPASARFQHNDFH